ncbi:MAG: hypothetical protein KDA37_16040 [Planctomycetales bacterium]|nr:hypothetical protein [Planctomycetales bacterium]
MPPRLRPTPRFSLPALFLTLLALSLSGAGVTADTTEQQPSEDPRYSQKLPLPDKHTRKDPIQANGPVFTNWPKPDATLVFTGAQDGYLEPCGCAGLTNQKGGLKRRHTFLKGLAADGWNPIPLDSGGQIRRFGQQAQIKLRSTLNSLAELRYQAIGFGTQDLRQDLMGILINFEPDKNPMTSANVGLFEFDETFSSRYRVIQQGGFKIGVTSILGAAAIAELGELADIDLVDPAKALSEVVPLLEKEKCDQLVLLVYGDAAEAEQLALKFPVFNWVVAGMGSAEPLLEPRRVEGSSTLLVTPGHKGQYAVAIGLYKGGDKPWRYQSVPLDHRFQDSPEMQQLLVDYQDELRSLSLTGLGIRAVAHPRGDRFAGSDKCADCHSDAWEVFSRTPHSHATKTLVELDPPRHFDPECLSCHVTGWNPQKYLPYNSGYASLQSTPHLTDNGCENCHGPAARHVAAENGDIDLPEQEIEQLRQQLHMERIENEGNMEGQELGSVVNNCLECHDDDNSPDFDFQLYWPHVEHHGKQ